MSDYEGPNRRKGDSIENRMLEVEFTLHMVKTKQDEHHHENKRSMKDLRTILIGDGLDSKGIVHQKESIECLEKLLKEHTKSDERAFSLLKWSIIVVGVLNLGELVVLVNMAMGGS